MNNGSSKTLTKSGRFEHVSRNTRVLFHFFFAVSHTSHRIRFFSFFFFSNESKQAIPFHRRRMVDFDASEKTHSTGRAIAIRWAEQTAFRQANGG